MTSSISTIHPLKQSSERFERSLCLLVDDPKILPTFGCALDFVSKLFGLGAG
jgi:hypothetical protein